MNSEQKPGDPADKVIDAKADGAFGGVSHRAGYGDDKLTRVMDFLRRHPRATLASGEGALLLAEIDRLTAQRSLPAVFIEQLAQREGELAALEREIALFRAGAKDSADHYTDACAEINRLRDQLYLADESARSSSAEAARLRAEIDGLNAQWERLATPDEAMKLAMFKASRGALYLNLAEPVLRVALDIARDAARREG